MQTSRPPDPGSGLAEAAEERAQAAQRAALARLFPDENTADESARGLGSDAPPAPLAASRPDPLLALLEHPSPALIRLLRRNLPDARVRQHWLTRLPEPVLRRLLTLCLPDSPRLLWPLCELWPAAWARLSSSPSDGTPTAGAAATSAESAIALSLAPGLLLLGESSPDPERLLCESLAAFAVRLHGSPGDSPEPWGQRGAALLSAAQQHLLASGQSALGQTLDRLRPDLERIWQRTADQAWPAAPTPPSPARPRSSSPLPRPGPGSRPPSKDPRTAAAAPAATPARPPARPTPARPLARPSAPSSPRPAGPPLRGRTAFSLPGAPAPLPIGQALYVDNAGLVLTAPFLPHLFRSLDLLGQDASGRTQLRDESAITRAVHLLQYLATGQSHTPEPRLLLNKLLCGLPIETVVAPGIDLSEPERTLCDFLLRSLIQGWTSIRGTSIAGLRETFLQREGKLVLLEDGWRLTVARKTLDILVDQIPWSFSVISHAWMQKPFFVTW